MRARALPAQAAARPLAAQAAARPLAAQAAARPLAALVAAFAWLAPGAAAALDLSVQRVGGQTALVASGEVARGDADRFRAALRQAGQVDIVVIRSPGGALTEGLEIGRAIRRAGLATHLPAGTSCASACTFAFLGGRIRTVDPAARFGVHMFSMSGDPRLLQAIDQTIRAGGPRAAAEIVRMVEQGSARMAAELAHYSIEMGVSLRLLEPNFRTDHTSIRWLTQREMRDLNVINAD